MKPALKRFTAAVTVAMLLLFSFAACGSSCEDCGGRGGRDREFLGIEVGSFCNDCWQEGLDELGF